MTSGKCYDWKGLSECKTSRKIVSLGAYTLYVNYSVLMGFYYSFSLPDPGLIHSKSMTFHWLLFTGISQPSILTRCFKQGLISDLIRQQFA
ncbi:MAG TPA: hypothetical protein DCM07_10260 [Planctomycetaceae bacterium]|nr:hypothetical protein [Planctomycetaceae bacterium]HBL45901.1 hypothetical protein [Planctomycetaceae bacterium]